MAQKNKVLFLFCALTTCCMNKVDALYIEGILGGTAAKKHELKYQASLKLNDSFDPLCGASIVGDRFLLATAACILSVEDFFNRSYKVVVGSINLKSNDGLVYAVKKIYIAKYYSTKTSYFDVSVLELAESLELEKNSNLSKLKIASYRKSYKGIVGRVSGYGYTRMKLTEDPTKLIELKYKFYTDWTLKYVDVKVIDYEQCLNQIPTLSISLICGKSVPLHRGQRCGPCMNDFGGPLVLGDEIIGILAAARPRCADFEYPSVYTEAYYISEFVNKIMNGTQPEETYIFNVL